MNTHIIHNVQTGEINEIPFSSKEEKDLLEKQKNWAIEVEEEKVKLQTKAALFERLGITEEEAKLLLG